MTCYRMNLAVKLASLFVIFFSNFEGTLIDISSDTQIQICTQEIVRILHYPSDKPVQRESLIISAQWEEVKYTKSENDNFIVVNTSSLNIVGDKHTGGISVYSRLSGKKLMEEKSRNFTAVKDMSTDTFEIEQSWYTSPDEALYGGGQFQNGIVNYHNAPIQLVQFNTEAIVPFFISSKGYGLLWDNYAWSYLNPVESSSELHFEMKPSPVPEPLADGASLSLEDCSASSRQKWNINSNGIISITSSTTENVFLSAQDQTFVLDCDGCAVGHVPHIWHLDPSFSNNQKWTQVNVQDGKFLLKNQYVGTCLGAVSRNSITGVVMYTCDEKDDRQYWNYDKTTGELSNSNNGPCLSSIPIVSTVDFIASESGDHFFYVDNCPGSFGCGSGETVSVKIIDTANPRDIIVVQEWDELSNLPDAITGRAADLVKGHTYRVTYNTNVKNAKVYLQGPGYNRTTLRSDIGELIDYYFMSATAAEDSERENLKGMLTNFDTIISQYRFATGTARLYGRWAYGFWQCKERYHSQEEISDAALKFRNLGIPVDNIVQDWHYWGTLGWGPHYDPKIYPHPKIMVETLHDLHFQLMVSVWSKFDENTIFFKNMTLEGQMINGTQYYDAYNPFARKQFYEFSKQTHFSIGVDALWLDATEPERFPNEDHELYLGTGNAYFNTYSLMTTSAISDGLRCDYPTAQGQRVFSLTRSSFAGQQRTGAALWSGDISGKWDSLRRQISASVNFAMSGMPYWSEDIGGFFRPNDQYTDPDYLKLMTRWFQFGVFTPIFRVHGGGSQTELWNYPASVMNNIIESAINLRYRLLAYIYSGFAKVDLQHYTMQRHLLMDFADDIDNIRNCGDEFMFGPSFLVAPLHTNDDSRQVYLPGIGSSWWNFYDSSAPTQGGTTLNLSNVSIREIPLFVKAGSIVPLGPYIQWHDEQPQDPLEIRIYPGADGVFELWEDDGKTNNYRNVQSPQYTNIVFEWLDSTKVLKIHPREGSFEGMRSSRVFDIVLVSSNCSCGGVSPTSDPTYSLVYNGTTEMIVNL